MQAPVQKQFIQRLFDLYNILRKWMTLRFFVFVVTAAVVVLLIVLDVVPDFDFNVYDGRDKIKELLNDKCFGEQLMLNEINFGDFNGENIDVIEDQEEDEKDYDVLGDENEDRR